MNMFDEVFAANLLNDLKKLREQAADIAGDWNGEDETYVSGGDTYTEEDAKVASEIEDSAKSLVSLLDELIYGN